MSWHPHQTVAVIVEQNSSDASQPGDRRFLMVEEHVEGRRVFNQPAGHLEPGETLLQAALREGLEETGWRLELTGFLGLYQYQVPGGHECFIRSCYTARTLSLESGRALDPDIIATHWLTLNEIRAKADQLRSPLVLQVLEDYCAGQVFPLSLVKVL